MIHVYHGDGKGKTTAAMGLALRMLAAGRRVVVVQFLKDGESGEVRLLAEHFGVPVFAGKASDKFTWSMTSEELAATCELHDGNLASALAELEGAQEGLLVLDEALDALSKGLVDEALVDRALDMSARGVEVALTGRAPSRKIVEKADYITEMRCEKHPYEQGICAREGVEYKMDSKEMAPGDIERRSFEIITEELGGRTFLPLEEPVVKRVIHTTADFSYADSLVFTHDAAHCALDALRAGATVLTDTNMALAGISKPALEKLGCKAVCYMADPDVAAAARATGTTRAVASMDKASGIEGPLIVAVGNAPTALLRLAELMDAGKIAPALVVGVPVGFVNVVEAKEELLARRVPAIVARGRKGGSNVAAAIMNALLYQITRPGGPK